MSYEPLYDRVYGMNEHSPEKRLWTTVLLLYLMDIQKDYDDWRDSLNGVRASLAARLMDHRHHVEHEWTETLCALADVEYESFKTQALGIIEGQIKMPRIFFHY